MQVKIWYDNVSYYVKLWSLEFPETSSLFLRRTGEEIFTYG